MFDDPDDLPVTPIGRGESLVIYNADGMRLPRGGVPTIQLRAKFLNYNSQLRG